MSENCCANTGQALILACSGGSNVGQLTNQAAVELTKEGFGKMFCLAGVGGNLPGFARAVAEAPALLVLDGCEVGCAKAILAQAGAPLRGHLVLTELGLVKNKELTPPAEQLAQVKEAAKKAAWSAGPSLTSIGGCACGK